MSQYHGQFMFRKPPAEITSVFNNVVSGQYRINSQTDSVVVWSRKPVGFGSYLLFGLFAFWGRGKTMTVTYADRGEGITSVDIVADEAALGEVFERDFRPVSIAT